MLTLGAITFSGFELPEKINFGGRQVVNVHKLPGGSRVVDAMGRDDSDIEWQGRFRSNSAARRARAVDAMRINGLPVTLSWGGFRYRVLVSEFKADYQQAYEIPYSVTCVVLTDLAASSPLGIPGLSELLGTDLTSALGLSGSLSLDSIADAVSGVQAAISAARTLKGAIPTNVSGIGDALAYARGVVSQGISAADSAFAAAGADADFASALTGQSDAASRLDGLHNLAGTLGRMAANVAGFR